MAITDDELFEEFIVLRSGYGNIHDVGYGWSHEAIVAIADAINLNRIVGGDEHEAAWSAVERYAKAPGRRHKATTAAC